jgi:hypothetical protein
MPADHPPIDPWLGNLSMPSYTPYRINVPFWHPNIDVSYAANVSAPSVHPNVDANTSLALAGIIPARHPNVTALILNVTRVRLPAGHPLIDPWLGTLPMPSYTPYRCVARGGAPDCVLRRARACVCQIVDSVLAPAGDGGVQAQRVGTVVAPGRAAQLHR